MKWTKRTSMFFLRALQHRLPTVSALDHVLESAIGEAERREVGVALRGCVLARRLHGGARPAGSDSNDG